MIQTIFSFYNCHKRNLVFFQPGLPVCWLKRRSGLQNSSILVISYVLSGLFFLYDAVIPVVIDSVIYVGIDAVINHDLSSSWQIIQIQLIRKVWSLSWSNWKATESMVLTALEAELLKDNANLIELLPGSDNSTLCSSWHGENESRSVTFASSYLPPAPSSTNDLKSNSKCISDEFIICYSDSNNFLSMP
jgi:hypothetical protein